jgi:MurNAc alpha-1-phosphate uridylyltransferase
MKALILAAGLGERMRPLTSTTPKPLLHVGRKPLIAWHLEKLAALGVRDVVINTSWLAAQFPRTLGDGARWGLRLHFAYEGDTPLETGGGMWNALPLLDDAPFLAVNGDIWTDYDFGRLPQAPDGDAHLVLVDNPPQHRFGDFVLRDGRVFDEPASRLTFAGIGVYRPELLAGMAPGRFPIVPTLRAAMRSGRVTGVRHGGRWSDVGTPQRLAELDALLRSSEAI